MDDLDRLTYTVPVIDSPADALTLIKDDPASGWYARRRLEALTASSEFEKLHPRGHDGKFIEKFGYVRWLFNGIWHRGEVLEIGDSGDVLVKPDDNEVPTLFQNPSKQLYSVPTPKAQLTLPNPKDKYGPVPKGFEKVGGQAGSNPGGFYTVTEELHANHIIAMPENAGELPEPGDKLYVKTAKSPDHAKQEVLANRLYEMAGVPVPDVTMSEDGTTIASTIVKGESKQELTEVVNSGDTETLRRIQEDMVVDAWLANWDVVGLSFDNMRVVDGVPYRLDAGGSLEYRAQGGAKGNKFGNVVGEIETLRNKNMNATAAKVFGGADDATLIRGAKRVAAISPEDIRAAVLELNVNESVADKLIARRKDIMTRFGIAEPVNLKSPLPEAINIAVKPSEGKPDLNLLVFDSVQSSWVPGEVVEPLQLKQAYNSSLDTWPGVHHVAVSDLKDGDLVRLDWALWRVGPITAIDSHRLVNIGTGEEQIVHSGKAPILLYPPSTDREALFKMLHDGVTTASINDYIFGEKHSASDVFHDIENTDRPTAISTITVPDFQVTRALLENVKHANGGAKSDRYVYMNVNGHQDILRVEDIVGDEVDGNLSIVGTDMDGNEHTVNFSELESYDPIQITNNDYTEQLLDAYFSLADVQKALLDADFPEEVPSVEPLYDLPETDLIDAADMAEVDIKPIPTTTPAPDLPTTPQYPPVDYVSVALPTNEKINLAEELSGSTAETLDIDLNDLNLVGRTFLFTRGAASISKKDDYYSGSVVGTKNPTTGYYGREGLYQVTSVQVKESYNGSQSVEIFGISASGEKPRWEISLSALQSGDNAPELVPVDYEMKPLQPAIYKSDGSVILGGMKVGTYKKNYSYKTMWDVTIDAAHSVYGVDTKIRFHNQKDSKRGIAAHVVPREILEPIVIPKHDAAKNLEQKFVGIDTSKSAGTLIGGDQASVGQWVMSTKDGSIGQITGFPNLDKYPGSVWVTYPDGTKKPRKISVMKGVPNPSAKEVVIPFSDVKLANGDPVHLGAHVRVGVTGKEIEGAVLKVQANGYILVKDNATGKKLWRKANSGVLLEAPDADAVPEMATGMHVSKPGKSIGAVKYPAPDGSILPASEDRDIWLMNGRALTKDGYVPSIGMRVRDSKGGSSLVVVRVKSVYDPSPNSVKVWDGEHKKYMWRAVTGLYVDHAAELGAGDSTIPRVKELFRGASEGPMPNLPDGSIVYKVVTKQYVPARGTSASHYSDVATMYVVRPTKTTGADSAQRIADGYTSNSYNAMNVFSDAKSVERVAVIDSSSNLRGQTSTNDMTKQQKLTVFDPLVTTHAAVINEQQVKELEAKLALAGGIPPKTVDATSITPLPRPHVPNEDDVYPGVPVITMAGSGRTLADPPTALPKAQSILGAVHSVIESRGSPDAGSSLHYGIGDAELIEDMTVRTQIVVDDDGKESVELRFHLLEPSTDKLAEQLLVRDGAKKGAWDQTSVYPKDLLVGDQITVRKSSSGSLKPGDGQYVPNATVAGSPTLIGQSTNSLDLYRIPVTFNDGSLGEVDAEQRVSPSITLHTFDFEKTQQGTGSITLNPKASKAGWTEISDMMGYAYGKTPMVPIGTAESATGIYLDENGRKHITDGLFNKVEKGKRLRRKLDDGSWIDVNITATEPNGRTTNATHSAQRTTINGDVTIRVPIPDDVSDRALETAVGDSVSHALEAVGIPPEKQAAPSKEQLTRFAINKVTKQYAKSYSHGKTPNVSPDATVDEAKSVLALIDDAVGDKLGRPSKLSDIRFKVWDGGRVSVVVSDDVAQAASLHGHRLWFAHRVFSDGGMESILTGTAAGLMASDERWSAGVLTSGMSPGPDQKNDAGNRVFLKPGGNNGHVNASQHGMIYFAPRVINASVDIYLNKGDGFGTRHGDNRSWLTVQGDAYELMYKRRLETSQIGYAVVNTAEERKKILDKLKKLNITHFGNRPVEDVVVVSGSVTIPPHWDANVGEGGVEVPLPDVIASPTTAPVAAGGLVSAAT